MATTISIPDGMNPQDLNALLEMLKEQSAKLAAPVPVIAAPAPKRTRKPKETAPASVPVAPVAPVPAPLTVTAPNGVRVNLSDPYRQMVEFTRKAITVLRQAEGKSKGIHSVYSGFNVAFGQHFAMAKEKVWETVDLMASRGEIDAHFCRGGKMLYLPGEDSQGKRANVSDVLAKILG